MFFFREKARTKVARFTRRWMVCSAVGMVLVITVADRTWADNDSDQNLYYYSIQQEVEKELGPGKRDLVDWAAELLAKKPKTVREALVKIDVLLRAGLGEEVVKTMTDLPSLYSDSKNPRLRDNIQHVLRGAMQGSCSPEVSTALIEAFPERVDSSMRSCMNQLFSTLRGQGWDSERIDEWIAKVQKKATKKRTILTDIPANFHENPYYKNQLWRIRHHDRPGTIWVLLRTESQQQFSDKARLLDTLEDETRKNPTDTLRILDYLLVWRNAPNHHQWPKPDPKWVAEVAVPKTSVEACCLGAQLVDMQQWKPAKKIFQKAKELFDKDEANQPKQPAGKRLFMKPGGDDAYRKYIEQMLKRCDAASRRSSSDLRRPAPIASIGTLMTSTSTASSTAVSVVKEVAAVKRKEEEQKILDEEKPSGDKPSYWLRRGEFYSQASYQKMSEAEILKAKQAFEKGLALTDPEADPQNQAKYMAIRKSLLQAYTALLRDGNQHDKVMKILLKELQVSKDETIIHLVTQHCNSQNIVPCIEPDEPILWQWLEKRKTWQYQEGLLLDILAKRAFECFEAMPLPNSDNEAPRVIYDYVARVEKLAKEGHVSRMDYCSRMLLGNTKLGIQPNPDRLIPLLQEKLKQKDLNDGDHLQLENNLFQAYLKGGQVKEADAMFKDPNCQLSGRVLYQELARMAATKHEKDIALRNWQRSANYSLKDSSQIQLNKYLLRYGFIDDIRKYYQDAQKKLPTFKIPEGFGE